MIAVPSRWKLRDFAPGGGLANAAQLETHADDDWLPVDAPGDVHRALIAAGRIPDPFYATNESACAWMEQREWWYRVRIDAAPGEEHQQIRFQGLDTFATIYLNGDQIGEHRNMFRPATFDASLRVGSNTLAVRFDPPLERIKGKTLSTWGRNPERTAMRKAQFGFGWDWGPRLPTIGIWRPVEFRKWSSARLVGVQFWTLDIREAQAAVAVRVEVQLDVERRSGTQTPLIARIVLTSPADESAPIEVELRMDSAERVAYLSVEQPRLWWTHELGEACLYDLRVTLLLGDEVVDRDERKVGIRTLELDQSPDPEERGTRFFRFVVNGVPIFAKGADWIPCDSFVGAIATERYTRLLELARDANMTMLRVWGGGIYEDDQFYLECDRLGILVWQDFMFACAMYPEDDPDFVAEVDAEARYQVRRLRSHPSLALWCGNNENQWLHERHYWKTPELPVYGAWYYDSVLPSAVADVDGHTPYWPGSPYGGDDHNSPLQGNVHNWSVWHGNSSPRRFGEEPHRENTPEAVSYRRYAEDLGRFVSEFGMHAAPVFETLSRVIPPDQRYHHSPTLDWHNKDTPKNKGDNLLLATTGLPSDLEQYLLYSQIAQAEGLKFGVEHFRRRKPHCSGTLVWQLDDCWPVLSWSVVDYYGFPKASYYVLRRAYAPVLASFKHDDGLELWLTNDRADAITDRVSVTLGSFAGGIEWKETREVSVAAGGSACVWRLDKLAGDASTYVSVTSGGRVFPANRHFFAEIKDLQRQPAEPHVKARQVSPHELAVELQAPVTQYVYFAHLNSPHESTLFSDNYIDLEPGERRELRVRDVTLELTIDELRLGWA